MSTESKALFDRLRAWVRGPRQRDRELEGELRRAGDAGLDLDDFESVWDATEVELAPLEPSALSFEQLIESARQRERRRAPAGRRAAAGIAAGIALTSLAVGALWWSLRGPSSVQLASFAQYAEAPTLVTVELSRAQLAMLAEYAPLADGTIRWIATPDDAYAIAAAVARPVFVFGHVEGCPLCKGLEQREFRNAQILARAERCVPLRTNLLELPPDELAARMQRSYPVLEVHDARRAVLHVFATRDFEVDVQGELELALSSLPSEQHAVPWPRARELSALLVQGGEALDARRFGDAESKYMAAARAADAPAFAALAARGLQAIETAARAAIGAAVVASQSDGSLARRSFALEAERFVGTRHQRDFDALLAAWRDGECAPALRYAR